MALIFFLFLFSSLAFSQEIAPSLTVDALFDFEVPQSIIESATWNTEAGLWYGPNGPSLSAGEISLNLQDDIDDYLDNLDTQIESSGLYSDDGDYQVGTNDIFSVLPFIASNLYSLPALNLALGDSDIQLGSGSRSPYITTWGPQSMLAVPSVLQFDNAPAPVTLGIMQPVSVTAPSFFVTSLTVSALEGIDGGLLSSAIDRLQSDSILYWLKSSYPDVLQRISDFCNQSWLSTVLRSISKLGAVVVFFFLSYKFCLSKVFVVFDTVLRARRKGGV